MGAAEGGRSREGLLMNADAEVVARVLSVLRQWGWEAGREKLPQEAVALLEAPRRAGVPAELLGWVRAGEALAAMRRGDYARAHECLDRARPQDAGADPALSCDPRPFPRGGLLSRGPARRGAAAACATPWNCSARTTSSPGRCWTPSA